MAKISVNNVQDLPDSMGMVDEGTWRSELIELEDDESRAGNEMVVATWRILEGPCKGMRQRDWVVLEPEEHLFKLKEYLLAYGCDGKVDMETDDMVGMTALLRISHETYKRDDGTDATRTNIAEVIEDEDNENTYTPPARSSSRERRSSSSRERSSGSNSGSSRERSGSSSRRRSENSENAESGRSSSTRSRGRRRAAETEDEDDDDLPF